MRWKVIAVITLAVAATPAAPRAQTSQDNFLVRNTGDLVALCSSQREDALYTAAQNFCQGYAVGLYQGIMAEQSALSDPLFCPKAQMPTRNEAIKSFVEWAQASPSRLQTSAVEGVTAFLAERLPCKARQSAK
jgi:hypothetical protein